MKNIQRWSIVTQPSMRSKFDTTLRIGFIPRRSATKTIAVNIVAAIVTEFNLGLYFASKAANKIHPANAISTKILK
jgi:hypothetical protein